MRFNRDPAENSQDDHSNTRLLNLHVMSSTYNIVLNKTRMTSILHDPGFAPAAAAGVVYTSRSNTALSPRASSPPFCFIRISQYSTLLLFVVAGGKNNRTKRWPLSSIFLRSFYWPIISFPSNLFILR